MNDLALERAAVELFEEIYELPAGERAARLEAATRDWPELRERVEALLAVHGSNSLQTGGASALLEEEAPPERIGAYRIVSLIGRGGMGSVYRAERMTGDFAHVAAVKIIREGAKVQSEDTGSTIVTKDNLEDPKVQSLLNPTCENPPL